VGIVYAALIGLPAEIGIYLAISRYRETAVRRRNQLTEGSMARATSLENASLGDCGHRAERWTPLHHTGPLPAYGSGST